MKTGYDMMRSRMRAEMLAKAELAVGVVEYLKETPEIRFF